MTNMTDPLSWNAAEQQEAIDVGPLESEMKPFKKACDATLLLDNTHGAKL